MEQQYLIYQTWSVQEWDRGLRPIEHIPLLGIIAQPWIDMTARDWRQTSFEVRTVVTSLAQESGVDQTPSVLPQSPNRRSIVSSPQVIFEASEAIPSYDQLPLAI